MSFTESADKKFQERRAYVNAWNSTMIKIWKEKIILLGAMRTGALYNSLTAVSTEADGKYLNVTLTQEFYSYGIFVNYGTGREVYRGNKGDIGIDRNGNRNGITAKNRIAKPWFSKKYYSSVMNLQEFFCDNLGQQAALLIADALDVDRLRFSLSS